MRLPLLLIKSIYMFYDYSLFLLLLISFYTEYEEEYLLQDAFYGL